MKNTREFGTNQEERAAFELEQRGCRILEHSFRCKCGEIDLIARQGEVLIFVEVKYRSTAQFGTPTEAVDKRKQRRISNAAVFYLVTHGYGMDTPCRFDVAAVGADTIEIIEDAFPYCGKWL